MFCVNQTSTTGGGNNTTKAKIGKENILTILLYITKILSLPSFFGITIMVILIPAFKNAYQ